MKVRMLKWLPALVWWLIYMRKKTSFMWKHLWLVSASQTLQAFQLFEFVVPSRQDWQKIKTLKRRICWANKRKAAPVLPLTDCMSSGFKLWTNEGQQERPQSCCSLWVSLMWRGRMSLRPTKHKLVRNPRAYRTTALVSGTGEIVV